MFARGIEFKQWNNLHWFYFFQFFLNQILLLDTFLLYYYFWFHFIQIQEDLIFPNGVKISAKKFKLLEAIPVDPPNDRLFVNSAFFVFFNEQKIKKKIKKGFTRDEVLKDFRESNKFEIMRSIYEYRVLTDSNGDVSARIRSFSNTFRVKLNNWWRVNVPKSKEWLFNRNFLVQIAFFCLSTLSLRMLLLFQIFFSLNSIFRSKITLFYLIWSWRDFIQFLKEANMLMQWTFWIFFIMTKLDGSGLNFCFCNPIWSSSPWFYLIGLYKYQLSTVKRYRGYDL